MLLEILTLLVLISIIVSSLLLARYISSNVRKDRELIRVRDDRVNQLIRRVEVSAHRAAKGAHVVLNNHVALRAEITEFAQYVDEQNASIKGYLLRLDLLANADMLAARRDELMRTKELKIALERLVSSATLARQQPAGRDLMAIEFINNRIIELETIIDEGGIKEVE